MESQYPPPEMPPPGPPTSNPQEVVKLPAIFLIVTGALGVLLALLGMVQGLGGSQEQLQDLLSDPNLPPAIRTLVAGSQSAGIFLNVITLLASAFVIFGSLKMMKLEGFGLAMGASIVAMIPCVGPCCCIGLPVGIWALVVLNKPEVKAAFR